jgi:cytochrome c2
MRLGRPPNGGLPPLPLVHGDLPMRQTDRGTPCATDPRAFHETHPEHADHSCNKVGPELNGLNGRKSGTAEGYSYSEANKNSGITWDEATFKDYIKDPKAKIPGTKMVFAGIKNEQEAGDLWAFLAQYDKDGKTK